MSFFLFSKTRYIHIPDVCMGPGLTGFMQQGAAVAVATEIPDHKPHMLLYRYEYIYHHAWQYLYSCIYNFHSVELGFRAIPKL